MQLILQAERRVELAGHPRLELGQRDARRRHRQVLERRRQDDVAEARRSESTKTSYMLRAHLAQVDERHAAVGLGVEVDEQRLALAQRQGGRQVDGGRRLADAALLIGDCENHRSGRPRSKAELQVARVKWRRP